MSDHDDVLNDEAFGPAVGMSVQRLHRVGESYAHCQAYIIDGELVKDI